MMSRNGPAAILISSTAPSNPTSKLYWFRKESRTSGLTPTPGAVGTAKVGEVKVLSPGFATLPVAAEFGAVSLNAVVVAHTGATPVCAVVQPAGNAGATTASKFSARAGAPVTRAPKIGRES